MEPAKREARRLQQRAGYLRQLLEAVERLVGAGESYATLSVNDLVDEAGISRSSFYKYFGDKSGLLLALSETVESDFLTGARAWLDLRPDAGEEEYRAAFRTIFDTYRTHRATMRLITEGATYDATMRGRYDEMMRAFVGAVAQHVRRGQELGRTDARLDAQRVATWLTWMLEAGQLDHIAAATDDEVDAHVAAVSRLVSRALAPAVA